MPADRIVGSSPPQNMDDPLSARLKAGRKRRTPGACDYCKKKKGDSSEMPGNRCSNCIAVGCECTHDEVLKTLRNMREYVEVLESRLKKMDQLLNKAMPGIDMTSVWMEGTTDETKKDDPPVARNDDELDDLNTKLISLRLNPKQNYFLGKSSGHQLVQTALEVKDEYIQGLQEKDLWTCKRQDFWEIPSWMVPHPEAEEEPPLYIYPENDLLISLVDTYFTNIHPFLPLLHRPTFEQSLNNKEHFLDHMFGGTVMLVCALASRYSNDPRVFVEGSGATTSAGWKWYSQVNVLRKSLFKRTSLYELQMYALSVVYAHSSQIPDGYGPKVGAHRRRKTPAAFCVVLRKRVLICLDRVTSSYSGRPSSIQEEDFDLDLPVDCDDEYWDQGFIQPLGKPSTMSFFIYYIKLTDILAYAMRVIYPIRRPKNLLGKAVHLSEKDIIAELDSAMNGWMDSIPTHLRWNPNCKDQLLLKQSAGLHAVYYDLQIFIHRPFIPSPARNPQPGAFPSLAICANAARLCCHVLDSYNKTNTLLLPQFQATATHSAIILLLNIWSGKKSELARIPSYPATSVNTPESTTSSKYDGSINTLPTRSSLQTQEQVINYSLPVYSTELGSLPVYGQFNFGDMDPMQNLNQNIFPVAQAATEQNHTPDVGQYFATDGPMDFVDNGSQNLFAAADFFVKNALYSGQTTYNDAMLTTLFPQHHTPIIPTNTNTVGTEETPTSIASSIFAAYDTNWD
ncbi:hypothetical protein BDQ17DRAFT_1346842, partial [Cyathus striatus]